MTDETRRVLQTALDTVRGDVVRLAAMVEEALVRATGALLESDLGAAQDVIDESQLLSVLSQDIEVACHQILALQSPLATDLRAIVATLRINGDLERAGTLMVNVAKATRRLYGTVLPSRVRGLVQMMSDEARRLIHLAADAYTDRNSALGAALEDIDDRLDLLQADFVHAIFDAHGAKEIDLQAAVQLALVARFFERVGDHAVNVGRRVGFIVEGHLPAPRDPAIR